MEQYFNHTVGQVAANNIYNVYIELRNKKLDISELSLQRLLLAVNYIKQENKLIAKKKFFNLPSFGILIVSLALIFITGMNLYSIISNGLLIHSPLFPENLLLIITMSAFILISILARALYTKTKYLHPILSENNQIIYELELEIQKRKLRGEK
ncbi:hypothetical protein J3U57_06120 [Gilliamella sp. B3464]|uniref:hypothetical protein n=1 Tax=unclassified Gilliamella TaxID=2685620 RepID=UPI0022699521|nr:MULTISPECIES: hypothetical protein [unclassified Gilliamella]MCX8712312.1 hypothetical protein [Gilliamella sp. B3468]MCX8751142.1 hypothetical protein [Gilliamella sp. B3464]